MLQFSGLFILGKNVTNFDIFSSYFRSAEGQDLNGDGSRSHSPSEGQREKSASP
jgi:hypothetical protein